MPLYPSLPQRGKVARRSAAVTDEVSRAKQKRTAPDADSYRNEVSCANPHKAKKASRREAFFSSHFSHRIVSFAAASAPQSVSVPLDAPIFSAAAANDA